MSSATTTNSSSIEHHYYATACGHTVVVKPVATIGGVYEGKWCCKIRGPRVRGGPKGIKTVYSNPNEQAAKEKIAEFLNVCVAQIQEATPAPNEGPRPRRGRPWPEAD